jgi:two-component system, cell cycle response regulator
VMPGLDESNRGSLFERLASAVACTPLMTCAGELTVQVSIGVATAEVDSSVDRLLERADAAMYRAKREGGNRVCYAEPGCARSCSDRDVADRGVM